MSLAVKSLQDAEVEFLEGLRPRYESEGYEFVIHPQSSTLPAFLASYAPDAVATRHDHSVAIEVKSRATPAAQQSIQRIRKLFQGHPDWRFTVAYMGDSVSPGQELPVADRATILNRAREAEQLARDGHLRAAFVLAWSLLEAALNNIHPDADKRPRTPGTVLQTLAMKGHLSPDAEQALRSQIMLRNRIVHGDVTAEPNGDDVRLVLDAVMSVLGTS